MKSIIFIVTVLSLNYIDGQQFRYDYTYFKDLKGWLKLHEIPANWHEARLRCQLEGSKLASPLDASYKSSMLKLIDADASCVYTGIHATFSRGDYFSVEGVPLAKIPHVWAKNEPDNYNDLDNCLIMLSDGTFADVPCNETFKYMCFKKRTQNLVVSSCGTVDSEYVYSKETGSCYKFHKTPRTWSRAYMSCSAEGGYLAIINNEDEAKVLRELFAKNPAHTMPGTFWKDVAYIGFHDWNEHGEWLTIRGDTLKEAGYDKFSAGEPNNSTTGEFCGSIYRTALLNDLWCEKRHAFICEKDVDSLLIVHDEK